MSDTVQRSGLFVLLILIILISSGFSLNFPHIHNTSEDISFSITPENGRDFHISPVHGFNFSMDQIYKPGMNITESGLPSTLNIVIGLKLSNSSLLSRYLYCLQDQKSPDYHHYLNQKQFDTLFGGSETAYHDLVSYIEGFGVNKLRTYPDRLSISFFTSTRVASMIFHTTFVSFTYKGGSYFTTLSQPMLPSYLSSYVSDVMGLADVKECNAFLSPLGSAFHQGGVGPGGNANKNTNAPANISGIQYIYGSDMQYAYDELPLFREFGYPTDKVIATILWSGCYEGPPRYTPYGFINTDTQVGPYVPSNIYSYFNSTLPSNEPRPKFIPVPLGNAPPPGPLASYDSTGANLENTLDVEMAGSMAPGSTIFDVYTSAPSIVNLTDSLAFILNPSYPYMDLLNVSAISNSWGSSVAEVPSWNEYLQEAAARGITVVASSGDSGDNAKSSKYLGTNVTFPSSIGFNTYGVISTGGLTMTLSNSLNITSQENWYISSEDAEDGGPAGTSSGISTVYSEPSWQVNSTANQLINGAGRAVPDISALANNTLITITLRSYTYNATNATNIGMDFFYVWGTSISSPIIAGMFATIDNALTALNSSSLGFADPLIYALGSTQFSSSLSMASPIFDHDGMNSSLPLCVFYPVTRGRNHVYSDSYGYSILNGWGDVSAFNLTVFSSSAGYYGKPGELSSVSETITLQNNNSKEVTNNCTFLSKEDLFFADALGGPSYELSLFINVTECNSEMETSISGSIDGVLFGPYFNLEMETFAFNLSTPAAYDNCTDISVNLDNSSTLYSREINVHAGIVTYSMILPGAAFIIGKKYYSYYSNGDYVENNIPDMNTSVALSPVYMIQGVNESRAATGEISFFLDQYGSSVAQTASTSPCNNISAGIHDIRRGSGRNQWHFSHYASGEPFAIDVYQAGNYAVTFHEYGIYGSVPWFLNLSGMPPSGLIMGTSYTVILMNGTYGFKSSTCGELFSPSYTPSFTLSGKSLNITITYTPEVYNITVKESGLPSGYEWGIYAKGEFSLTSFVKNKTLHVTLFNGSYDLHFISKNNTYAPVESSIQMDVSGASLNISAVFHPVIYDVVFSASGLPFSTVWSVNLSGNLQDSSLPSMEFGVINGTYGYEIIAPRGYQTIKSSGVIRIDGSPAVITVLFQKRDNIPSLIYIISGVIVFSAAAVFLTVRHRKSLK